jgi:hypothetical protein
LIPRFERLIRTISFQLLYGLVILRHARRRLVTISVTSNPTAAWLAGQVRPHRSHLNSGWAASPICQGSGFDQTQVPRNVQARWKNPPITWQAAKAQTAIQFEDRFILTD